MNVVRRKDPDFAEKLNRIISPSSLFDKTIEQRTRAILEDVQARGDEAVLELTERFDGAKLTAEGLAVTQAEFMTASLQAEESLRAAVSESDRNIAVFGRKSRRKNWRMK